MTAHRFVVGQVVRMRNRFGLSPSSAETYRITAILPAREDKTPQYRIRNDNKRHERVTTEDSLEEITVQHTPRTAPHSSDRNLTMAKGQKRSNREIRKPKQEKAPAKTETPLGSQVKLAGSNNIPRGKAKS
ncbi:hypothetical protein [Mesorhizobium xinjiangense]|uniref:hypothetical protein n=1 Tax=Mesorhizobium xinjiangense TaxID=2678685 RepID=UPI001F1E4848|nr:hypothetical protein [Mesorhizobium xinjiangense]